MRWDQFRKSDNVEDRRSGGRMVRRGGLGMGTIMVLGIAGYMLGIDPQLLISGAELLSGGGGGTVQTTGTQGTPDDELGRFAGKILGNTEDVWTREFQTQLNAKYTPPGMVLFSGSTSSGCGFAESAMGPFYCPTDQKVYVDLSFFEQMRRQFGAGGDFAYAYVIAHEVGHHVENQIGLLSQVNQQRRVSGEAESNRLSVRIELMADCLAGVWAYHSNQNYRSLEQGDIEEALQAAQAIGDDMLQKKARGYAVPDSFTHGTSQQRMQWLSTGLKDGKIESCNTFQ
ncbi:MAG: neutral zinc metallopeptidase [Methylobacteriaceae bacterium]|nr:neutral zinc metallopeptidase [Methylobacteriaceae bacterium]